MSALRGLSRFAFRSALIMSAMTAPVFAADVPAAAPAPASANVPTGPSFQTGGIKATVTSVAGKDRSVSISLLLDNKSQENLMIAVIGPPVGTNSGNVYQPKAVGGVASCIYNPRNYTNVTAYERSEEVHGCLLDEKAMLAPSFFTEIDAGNAIPMNVAFDGPTIDQNSDFSLAMNVAVFKEHDLNSDDGSALTSKTASPKLPKSLRYLSVGITAIPLKPATQ